MSLFLHKLTSIYWYFGWNRSRSCQLVFSRYREKNVCVSLSVFFLSINWHQLTIHHLVNELFIYCHTDKVGGLFISEEIPSEMEIAPRYTLLTLLITTRAPTVRNMNSYNYILLWLQFSHSIMFFNEFDPQLCI